MRVHSVLDAIGNTPLVPLRHLLPTTSAPVLVKLESTNPAGSMKDRMASAAVEGAEGSGYVPPLWRAELAAEIMTVSTQDAIAMARRLAREEALFAGTSSGANATTALRLAERLGPNATVVTILVDSGLKYLTTDLYRSSP